MNISKIIDINTFHDAFKPKKKMLYKEIIKNQIFSSLLIIFLISFSIYTVASLTILSKVSKLGNQTVEHISNETNLFLKYYNEKLDFITSNQEIRSFIAFNNQFSDSKDIYLDSSIKNFISKFLNINRATNIQLYTLYTPIKTDSLQKYNSNFSLTTNQWYEDIISLNSTTYIGKINNLPYHTKKTKVLSLLSPIYNYLETKIIGFISVDFDKSLIDDFYTYNKTLSNKSPILILDKNGNTIFSSINDKNIMNILLEQNKYIVKEKKLKINNNHYLVNKVTSDYTNFTFITITSIGDELGSLNYATLIIIPIILFIFLLTLLFSYNTSKKIAQPINELINTMSNTELGNLNIQNLHNTEIYEIEKLCYTFNNMMSQINYLIDKNQKSNLLRMESHFFALQQKINPHFLFNSLEFVSSQAILENAPITSEISQKLGYLFRYHLQTQDIVPISKEIRYIEDYLFIHKLRFEKLLDVVIDIDPFILNCKIPKLTLQPLIENTIKHGFLDNITSNHYIHIKGEIVDSNILISIVDDGCGIPSKEIEILEKSMKDDIDNFQYFIDRKKHIGLRNVNTRLCLTFKIPNSIKIKSIPYYQTTISLQFPIESL